ncbi:MAG: amidohydrolase family protein, partial [Thermomicrobiales bacterium]
MFILDANVHVNDTPGEFAPYCDMPWRPSLEELAQSTYPYLLVPGFAPNFKPDPPIPGAHDARSVDTAEKMRKELTE